MKRKKRKKERIEEFERKMGGRIKNKKKEEKKKEEKKKEEKKKKEKVLIWNKKNESGARAGIWTRVPSVPQLLSYRKQLGSDES